MAVRLDVRLKAVKGKNKGREVTTTAVLNTGYETEYPEAIFPREIAEALGFLPELPVEARDEVYFSVSGKFTAKKIPEAVEISSHGKKIVASVVISDFEREVLLSDASISSFGIIIEDAKLGKWRFREQT